MEHVRDVRLAPKRAVTAVNAYGEPFADLRFLTETDAPITLRLSRSDLQWLHVWAGKVLEETGESAE